MDSAVRTPSRLSNPPSPQKTDKGRRTTNKKLPLRTPIASQPPGARSPKGRRGQGYLRMFVNSNSKSRG